MRLEKSRFRAIMEGTATNLDGQEILVRNIAYRAERQGRDPREAIEQELPFVRFTDDGEQVAQANPNGPRQIPPLQELLGTSRQQHKPRQIPPLKQLLATSRQKQSLRAEQRTPTEIIKTDQPPAVSDKEKSDQREARLLLMAFAGLAVFMVWLTLATGKEALLARVAFSLIAGAFLWLVVIPIVRFLSPVLMAIAFLALQIVVSGFCLFSVGMLLAWLTGP